MLEDTRLVWISWSLKRQHPGESWLTISPTTPPGKPPNQHEEFTYPKPTTSGGRLESRWFVHTALLTGCFRDYLVTVDRIRRTHGDSTVP